jgi:hypothetical protein
MQKGEMLMKRGRTALTWWNHLIRAAKHFGYTTKQFKALMKKHSRESWFVRKSIYRKAFGDGPNPKVSVLLVPELRKRRSERDPVLLKKQIEMAATREAEIRDSFNSGRVAKR